MPIFSNSPQAVLTSAVASGDKNKLILYSAQSNFLAYKYKTKSQQDYNFWASLTLLK